jgi:Prokaryotic E2 family E
MPKAEFIAQLTKLGYAAEDLGLKDGHERVALRYVVPCGRFAGKEIRLGFIVPGDFPNTPPSGPHVSPQLLPLNSKQGSHPDCGIQASPIFGADWQYWSRPLNHWRETERTVKDVMRHINHLFDTIP